MNEKDLNIEYICDKTLLNKDDELVPIILDLIQESYKAGLCQAEFDNTMNLIEENQELKQKYLNSVADYETAMAEKSELKKQVETYEIEGYEQNKELNKMSFDIKKYKTQQKEFIKWLEDMLEDENDIFSVVRVKDILYKGLYQWLLDNKDYLQEQLIDNSAICGEWLGMGCLKYSVDEFDKRFYMFAKANIDDEFNLYNLIYDHNLFIYPFVNKEIPKFIGVVPEVIELLVLPTKEYLDSIYETYTNRTKRNVEGFVVNYKNIITKYVRMKNGKLQEHFDRGE